MKKALTILFVLVFLCGGFMQAQAIKSIAVKSGIIWATQKWDYKDIDLDYSSEYRTGFHLGVSVEFLQHKYFSILTELGYTQKGYKIELPIVNPGQPEGNLGTMVLKYRFSYVYLSPMFKVRKEFGGFVPYVFIGPRLDYQLDYPSDLFSKESATYFNDFIFGMTYGLGIEYMFGSFGVGLIFQNQYDFTLAYHQEPEEGYNTGFDIKNNAFIVDLGVKYYFGKQ